MVEKKKPPIRIDTDEILDPQCRWICQRLDTLNQNLVRVISDVLPEIREMNGLLKEIKDQVDFQEKP